MKAKTLFMLIAAFVLMISCEKTPDPLTPEIPGQGEVEQDTVSDDDISGLYPIDTVDVDHYVLMFTEPKSLRLGVHATKRSFSLDSYETKATYGYKDDPNSEAGKKYLNLCKRYNDISYDNLREFWLSSLLTLGTTTWLVI